MHHENPEVTKGLFTTGDDRIFNSLRNGTRSPEDSRELQERYADRANQIFTPGEIASGDMYISRDDTSGAEHDNVSIERRVEEVLLSPSFQLLLFGDSGVGKTNIVIHLAEKNKISHRVVNIRDGDSAESAINRAITSLEGPMLSMVEKTEQTAGSSNLTSKTPIFTGGLTSSSSATYKYLAQGSDPWETLSNSMINHKVDLLLFDNLQNMNSSSERSSLGSLMEYFYDRRTELGTLPRYPKIAVAGISSNGEDLIANNDSRYRRIRQIPVSHMADEKIGEIATTGFGKLNQKITDEARRLIEFYSDGFPFFAHDLCLSITKLDNIAFSDSIDCLDVEKASARMSGGEQDSMRDMLKEARGRQSKVRVRAKVLQIIATSNWPSWTSRNVHDEWKTRYPETKTRQSDITNALNELAGKVSGLEKMEMLTRSGSESSGFSYSFRNPHFRPYIRMHPEQDMSIQDVQNRES